MDSHLRNHSISTCLVTTSLGQDWVICAPAAFLGCGSRLSGSLSGTEPDFPVTRHGHGSPIHYRPELIGQKLTRVVLSHKEITSDQ